MLTDGDKEKLRELIEKMEAEDSKIFKNLIYLNDKKIINKQEENKYEEYFSKLSKEGLCSSLNTISELSIVLRKGENISIQNIEHLDGIMHLELYNTIDNLRIRYSHTEYHDYDITKIFSKSAEAFIKKWTSKLEELKILAVKYDYNFVNFYDNLNKYIENNEKTIKEIIK